MRKYLLILISALLCNTSCAQAVQTLDRYLDSGAFEYEKGNYEKAISLFRRSVLLQSKSTDKKLLNKSYNNLANTYAQIGRSEIALKYYLLSLSLSKDRKDTLNIAKTSKNIGSLYEEQKDFSAAMQYYQVACNLAKKADNASLVADCLNNTGVIYEQQVQYDKALTSYKEALKIYKSENNAERIAMTLNNLAIVYKYLKRYSLAIQNYSEALAIAEKSNDQFVVAATWNNLGNVFALTGDYQKSLDLCSKANATAKTIKAQQIIVESYDGIATAHEKLNHLVKAIEYRKLYEQENASFINAARSGQLAEMQVKYETAKKVGQIKSLVQNSKIRKLEVRELALQIQRRNFFIVGFLLLFTALLGVGYFWKRSTALKNQIAKEKIIRDTEEIERSRIAKDIHDDLGSGLSKINFLSEIIFQKSEAIPEIRISSASVKETATKMIENMRDLIWALNPDNTTLPNLLARIREYTTDYLEDYAIDLSYDFPNPIPKVAINKEAHREIFMVVKETLNNITKHANATSVCFNLKLDNDEFILSIKDNGIGFITEKTSYGNGLRNMRSRLQAINGTWEIKSLLGKGTETYLSLPILEIIKNNTLVTDL
ncbi:MAG: sensor histidine kinase [Burkholderiales bacterium]|nr:sensor histidine kinase [Flavobacterium sp.]